MTVTKKELKQAASFYARLLRIHDFELKFKIKSSKRSNGYIDRLGLKKFKIMIADDGPKPLRSLAHEMVHVAQYLSGRMVDTIDGVVWEGTFYPDDPTEDGYFDSPWEIEAFGRQVGLYERYLGFLEGTYKEKNVIH